MAIIGFPLLLIPLAICNIVVFLMPGLAFEAPLATLRLPSGVSWALTVSDVLLSLGILLLLLEVIKGARPGAKYVTDHLLSLLVFAGAAAEFGLLPQFGTSTFFMLALLALVDFLAGIALRNRPRPRAARAEPAPPAQMPQLHDEPAIDPAPKPAIPAAASIAEAVLLDRPEPVAVTPAPTSPDSSPRIQSPGLQPDDGSNPSSDPPR
ncbi:MAG: hypothetical protein HXX15_08045 [Rhodopseudomonas sp.]|uniref:hypothetical protein n=1 Tax=Rhodopseudomonas sp. TaxID=1078 RepID=UPI00181F55FD|nr:hypothetical protein [Rhodopseudomonas sp.]NVN86028.1 hypothetical protein [Rhodopseudomonas sp.]